MNEMQEIIEYLEKRKYVYRKSFKYYYKIYIALCLGEIIFTGSALSAFAFAPLVTIALGTPIIAGLKEWLNIKEKMLEFKKCHDFYNNLLFSYKAGDITKEEIFIKEREFLKTVKYFCVEKYLKKKGLNGYAS